MEQQIHAHKILNQLKVQPMTEEQLRHFIATEFGSQALFRTCKLNGMDVEALLTFFQAQHKVLIKDGIWHLNQAEICQH
ncbi:YecH family metal-binding protein [Vibrio ziniensis]|uniref:YecH family protein n=1 Tax=Vibrio ziniensis TaxID=2711221 RepID=A0A6G7CLS9_9VIBR|nr:YecH family metal-binding protein [Vibrio ziniensis]QIH43034.1 YecH family protein [Vibrio ziniensis]